MKSKQLDDMTIDEVLRRCRVAGDGEYWQRVAKVKLSEYRQLMPRLAKFVPDCDWRTKADQWERELAAIAG